MKSYPVKTPVFIIVVFLLFFSASCSGGKEGFFSVNIGGADYDSARAIIKTGENRYFLAGMTTSYGVGHVDVFAIMVNSKGKILKYNTFGGRGDDRAFAAVNAPGGGFAAAGYTTTYGAGNSDFYLVKMNKKLELEWAKTFGHEGPDECRAVDTNGVNYALAGFMTIENTQRPVLVSASPSGLLISEHNMPWQGQGIAHFVKFTGTDGALLVTGGIKTPDAKTMNGFAVIFKKTEAAASRIFESKFPKEVKAAVEIPGGYVFAGEEGNENDNSDIVLFATDESFNIKWKSVFGGKGSEFVSCLNAAPDGGFLITGTTESKGNGSSDIYLIRTDGQGVLVWEKTYGTKRDEYGGKTIYDKDRIVSAGWTLSEDRGYDIFFMNETDVMMNRK